MSRKYGLRVLASDGTYANVTTKIGRILASGTLTMSNSLEADDTYGEDVSLGDTYPLANIGVIAYPTVFDFKAQIVTMEWTGEQYPFSWFGDDTATYYTKNASTGIMTAFTAGALTVGTATAWDGIASAYPLASWDYLDAETSFSSVRIWAAMAHIIYDASATAMKAVYTIGDVGVSKVDYVVFLKGS